MNSHAAADRSRFRKRLAAGAVALAVAVGAPAAALAATSSGSQPVHAQVQKSGAVIVSGYDGGAPLAPNQ
jgi:hypothetical protein